MLETLEDLILTITDPLLGWLLWLPRDVALLIVALLTGLILTLARKWTTDQPYLARCNTDKRRLKELVKEAKKKKDREARKRLRRTLGQLGAVKFKAEGKPLLLAIVPIAMLAVWAFARIAYMPVAPDEAVTVNAYYPLPGIGRRVHMVPQQDVVAENGWIQQVRPVEEDDFAFGIYDGMASWEINAKPRNEPYSLNIRFAGESFGIPLQVHERLYTNPIVFIDDPRIEALTVDLTEYRPFGFIPGIPMLMLQPWIIGYLIFVVPLSLVLKRIMRVH